MASRSAAVECADEDAPRPDESDPWLAEGFRVAVAALRRFRRISAAEAEDLAQELVIVYWLRTCAIRDPRSWFMVCARHRALRHLKQQARRAELLAHAPPVPRDEQLENRLDCRLRLAALPPVEKWVFEKYCLEGFTLAEIAVVSGRSIDRVFSAKRRALNSLRR